MRKFFTLILFGLVLGARYSLQYQSNYNYLTGTGGQVFYNSIFPQTNPVFTSNAYSFYVPYQSPESIRSQEYHPEDGYTAGLPPGIEHLFNNVIRGRIPDQGSISNSFKSTNPTQTKTEPKPKKKKKKGEMKTYTLSIELGVVSTSVV